MTESVLLSEPAAIRCSDADRERTSERLRNAATEGRLTMDELEERLTGVYAARYHLELDALVADLPKAGPAAARTWHTILATIWAQLGAEATLLLGRGGIGWTRRRLLLAAIVSLLLVGLTVAAIHGLADGPEHHGIGGAPGFEGPGAD